MTAKIRESISYPEALPVLTEYMSQDQIDVALKISKPAMLKEAASSATRAEKKKVREDLMSDLREAGHVEAKTIIKTVVRNAALPGADTIQLPEGGE